MPASKVRKKARTRIAADRKRLRDQDIPCPDACCTADAPGVAVMVPPLAPVGVKATPDRP
jgi:hypothetical protein